MKVYRLRLTVRGPILTQSTAIGAFGVDSPVAREADGTPYLAGSHVTGKLRQALLELADAAGGNTVDFPVDLETVCHWLGGEDLGRGDARKIVLISDLRAVETKPVELLERARRELRTRTRVAIDEVTGTALEGALQVMETPFPAGAKVTFAGHVRVLAPDAEATTIERALRFALAWIPQVGGERTIGFGRLLKAKLDAAEAGSPQNLPHASDAPFPDRWRLLLRFLEPFCIAKPLRHRNTFVGDPIVPGGAVKGALASQMAAEARERPTTHASTLEEAFPKLAEHFSALQVSHLFPVRLQAAPGRDRLTVDDERVLVGLDLRRPVQWPHSLVRDGEDRLYDVAFCDGPRLLGETAPAFFVDWKTSADVEKEFGWAWPRSELRIRTAMSFEQRAAKAEQLFGYEMVLPDEHLWLGHLDLAAVPEAKRRALLEELIALVTEGLAGIGKTAATAQVILLPDDTAPPPTHGTAAGALHVLTLQTPALLCTPDDMSGAKGRWKSAADRLHAGYASSFEELSQGAFTLVRFFARQRLAGGVHYAAAFMGDAYKPFLVTEPGAVFVLEVAPGRAQDAARHLHAWFRHGLDIPKRVRQAHDLATDPPTAELWQRCPFIPENGYGEVAVDLAVHRQRDATLVPDSS